MNTTTFKEILRTGLGSLAVLFKLAVVGVLLAWLVWAYVVSFGSAKVENKAPAAQVTVNVDQSAYKAVEEYLGQVRDLQLPDYGSAYANPEPFREYR